MEATVIVTFLALAQYSLFGIQVGALRGKLNVPCLVYTSDAADEGAPV